MTEPLDLEAIKMNMEGERRDGALGVTWDIYDALIAEVERLREQAEADLDRIRHWIERAEAAEADLEAVEATSVALMKAKLKADAEIKKLREQKWGPLGDNQEAVK